MQGQTFTDDVRKITQREGASHGCMRLTNWERAPPRAADTGIVISRGNDGAQISWSRRDRDYLSRATERSLTPPDDLRI